MNIIPTIFNHALPSYTVVGGIQKAGSTGLSAILLNRGGRYPRRTLFQELEKSGFDYIVSIEGLEERYDVEDLSSRFPSVKFILLKQALSIGEQINLAVSEIPSPLFFVLWNDIRILHGGGAAKIAERMLRDEHDLFSAEHNQSAYKRLCTVPVIQNSQFETLPTCMSPAFYKKSLKTVPSSTSKEGGISLYPFDGVGIYDRERFIQLGGFDPTLSAPHWQLMDFGFRSWLWGETIASTQLVRMSYDGDIPSEDSTAEESYKRFYLKNIAPVFRGDLAHIPLRRYLSYVRKSGDGVFEAWEDFSAAREWVEINQYRFKSDAQTLIEHWEKPAL
ncbi:MAG: hypothetical protein LBV20_05105 [Treponema sp.]|jgi:hypothetical protein|nr:hypothetical protein [Treponema sp.]